MGISPAARGLKQRSALMLEESPLGNGRTGKKNHLPLLLALFLRTGHVQTHANEQEVGKHIQYPKTCVKRRCCS